MAKELKFDYDYLIQRLNREAVQYNEQVMRLSMDKTRVERQLDLLLCDVHRIFGDHPKFAELVDRGHFHDWTGNVTAK
jgi:hypothetical protein